MNRNDLNLSRRPFANLRPLKRVSLLLWLAGGLMLVLNVRNYWSHFSGENQARSRMLEIERELGAEKDAVGELRREVGGLNLETLNERSRFVNEKIEQRTFSWSSLFDRLTEALPNDVRLSSLTPKFDRKRRSGRAGENLGMGEVGLEISGAAKNDEALLALVDAFFEHGSFREPDLQSEDRGDDGLLEFELSVIYRPGASAETDPEPPGGVSPASAEAAP
ncbi:MAG: hypothetical protein OES47_00140 [Acidobacteriota bacterium]|nr:hypothetical protein [Acidobacteriota bacterium]